MSGTADLAPASSATAPPVPATADDVVAHTLLNCYLREVAEPERQATLLAGRLGIRLPRQDVVLSVAVRRPARSGAHRFTGPVSLLRGTLCSTLDWRSLAERIAEELHRATGVVNDEFVDQVEQSHAVTRSLLRRPHPPTGSTSAEARYLESERALLLGHRFHPTPKSRSGDSDRWQVYAPETGSTMMLRKLAVLHDLVGQDAVTPGDLAALDGLADVPAGHLLLPVHPWQYELLRGNTALDAALRSGNVLDLGPGSTPFAATSSVRTLYGGGGFLKFSLNVRITNCVRKNSAYELAGAPVLTRLLDTELAGLRTRFPGFAVLREPAYRTVAGLGPELLEGFGVIVRESPVRHLLPGVTPLLAGAIADEYPCSGAHVSRLLGEPTTDRVLDWWRAYLRLLLPPVLAAFFQHGVVFEPHLQNVLVGVDPDGMPAQMLLRDMEGTKLVGPRHAAALSELDPSVAGPLTYDRAKGWRRTAYCLLVNHLSEVLAALADQRPDLESTLWELVTEQLGDCAEDNGRPAELTAVLAGVPVPAKTNLLTRWRRSNDRESGYVPLALPLGTGQ
ncbi:MAG TPA: IucA/IucC family protein [Pseudonocardiaceae bacterium]|jgi:siderophore synthetase component|nr:IucA/IucC family protein [Pseudonocardiaceae bacterium]